MLIKTVQLLLAGAVVTSSGSAAGHAAHVPASMTSAPRPTVAAVRCVAHPKGIVHRHAPGAGRTVALTFDDGPGRDTGRILRILAKAKVPATFFDLGVNEKRHPSVVRREAASGYVLGDHTWDHATLTGLEPAAQAREIDRELRRSAAITGHRPCLLRPPGGSFDDTTLRLARDRNLQVWNWSVDTEDWKAAGSGAAYWVRRITDRATAGHLKHPVVLMHNQPGGNPATVAALPKIIRYYQDHHYRFVDLGERR